MEGPPNSISPRAEATGSFTLIPISRDPPEALSILGSKGHGIIEASHGNPPTNKMLAPHPSALL